MNTISQLLGLRATLEVDVFTTDFEIIAFLFCNKRAGIDEIRRDVRGSPGAVSYKIRDLVERGIVVRHISATDGRASSYELSDRTGALLEPIAFAHQAVQSKPRAA